MTGIEVWEFGFSKAVWDLCPEGWKKPLGDEWEDILKIILTEWSPQSYLCREEVKKREEFQFQLGAQAASLSRRDTVESDAIPFFRASPHFRSHFSCLLHHPRHLRRVVCPVTYPATIHTSTSASSCFFALGLRGSSTAFICSYNRLTWTGVFSHLHFQSKTIGQPLMFRP